MSEANGKSAPSQLLITIQPNGAISFQSNCTSKIVMVGMLEIAKQLILHPKDNEVEVSPIVVARGSLA